MKSLKKIIGKKILLIDGAMGTLLMEGGVSPKECFDAQNLTRPALIKSIHKRYVQAGANIIETNTFGANRLKLKDYNLEDKVAEINKKAVSLAKEAANDVAFVCGSIGPLGKILAPLGDVPFDLAVDVFSEQAKALEDGGADCLSIETISDLQEMRAAIIGAKSLTKLPIMASLTYDENGTTVFGTPPEAAVIVLEALGVDVISANCSTGPEGIIKIAKILLQKSALPIMVMPNAGMPIIENDKAVYKMTPEKFALFAKKLIDLGVSIVGGCCGTTPEHIAYIKKLIPKGLNIKKKIPAETNKTKFSSRIKTVEIFEGKFLSIGERINPTGRILMREDIKSNSFVLVREEAIKQSGSNADLLDINVSVPEGNDSYNMAKTVHLVQKAVFTPLSIDSPNQEGLESGLKEFCGRALLNSVNAKNENLTKGLSLAKKYGAAIIGLTIDEKGIPKTKEDKLKIAKKIVKGALNFGIKKHDIFIDPLVMTAAIGLEQSLETLEAIALIKQKLKVKTSLGISNISHGLPNRSKINALFLELALFYGLDAGIIDVTDPLISKVLRKRTITNKNNKTRIKKLIRLLREETDKSKNTSHKTITSTKKQIIEFKNFHDIEKAVIEGDTNKTKTLTTQALAKGINPQEIIDKALTVGMETVGERFSKKIYFLPQVLSSAEAMSGGFELCKEKIPKNKEKKPGTVLIATVYGDIHDIGKNIVKMMLENHGFELIDLGKDVHQDVIIEAAKKYKPSAIALSALLTTTMLEMKNITQKLKDAGLNIPVIVGGAVVTEDYAKKINAGYGADAAQAVKLAKEIIKKSTSLN